MVTAKKSLNYVRFDLIRQIFLANFFAVALPYKVTFALTYRCNLRCKYCKTWARPEKDELSLDEIKSVLNSLLGLRWLHFTGGEIFLREDIEEILNFSIDNKRLAVMTLPTNGFFTDRILKIMRPLSEKLKGIKLVLTCSIDGTKEIHDNLRGADGIYDKCIETFIKLRAINNIKAYLGVTVSGDNYRGIPHLFCDLQERIPNFAFNELHFNFIDHSFFYNNTLESSGEPRSKEAYFFVDKLRKLYKSKGIKSFLENRYFKLIRSYLDNRKSPIKCSALNGSCFIDPYGDVYPCINYEERIGNIKPVSYNFIDFWRLSSGIKDRVRKIIEDKRCPGCWTPCEAYPSILHNLIR